MSEMAGGAGITSDSQPWSWVSPSFEAMCEWTVKCLTQPGFRVVGVCGWNGVGRQRVLRHAVEILEGGGGGSDVVATTTTSNNNNNNDPPLTFAHILKLSKQEDETEMGRRIQEMLQSIKNDAGEPFEDWWEPLMLLQHATLVVIEQDLSHTIQLDAIFGLSFIYLPYCHLKIVVPFGVNSTSPQLITSTSIWGNPQQCGVWIIDNFSSLGEEEAWELLRHEADEMADELYQEQQLPFNGDAIMEFFLYTTLFKYDLTPLHTYWWCEGLVLPSIMAASTATNRIIKTYFDMFDPLLTKFRQRSMFGDDYVIQYQLQSKIRTIATTLYQSPPSKINKKGRFMVAINEDLKELPPDMERWDQQGITRVSLQANKIERLQQYPPSPGSYLISSMSDIISSPKCEYLSTLILSHNPLSEGIQDDFFQRMNMPNLHVLDLSYTEKLKVLPTSLTCLTNLRLFNLKMCPTLHTISPFLDRGFPNLEILNIRSCPLLGMTNMASFRQVPNLRLLVTDYKSLLNLEVLDLSGTKIESLPELLHTNESKTFTRLDLIDTKHLYHTEWPNFTRMPTIINWDQCGCCTVMPYSADIGYLQICVQEVAIFRSLTKDHVLWSQPFQEFHIHVHPCTKHPRQHHHRHSHKHHHRHPHREYPPSPYKNINLIPGGKQYCQNDHRYSNYEALVGWRYLHICGVSTTFTHQMEGVLPNMHSLQLCNHASIKHLLVIHQMELRTCQVVKCSSMETVFYGKPTSELAHLESISLIHLIRLETLYRGHFGSGSFIFLRSVYIDNCPRMVTVFSSTLQSILLPQLKELVIRSCSKLIEVFGRGVVGSTVAPALNYLFMWDLSELRNVCDGNLPALRTLQLRGCVKLRALPLPSVDSEGKPFKLDITAEQKWWDNLNEANKKHIIFKPWSPWTARN